MSIENLFMWIALMYAIGFSWGYSGLRYLLAREIRFNTYEYFLQYHGYIFWIISLILNLG